MTALAKKPSKRLATIAVIGVVVALTMVLASALGCSPQESGEKPEQAPEQQESEGGMDTQPINWSMDSDCAACHTTEAGMMTDAAYPQSSEHADEACVSCHTEESVLATAHEGSTMGDRPASKATVVTVGEKSCIDCHGTMEELASKNAELTDSNGITVNPHKLPDNESHADLDPTCTDCHKIHSDDVSKDAIKYCADCHHRGTFQCGNCHEVHMN